MKKLLSFCVLLVCVFSLSLSLSLPVRAADSPEILLDPGFETGSWDDYWMPYRQAVLEQTDETSNTGDYSVLVTERFNRNDTPRQYVTQACEYYGMGQYKVSAWVRLSEDYNQENGPVKCCIAIQTKSTDESYTPQGGGKWFTSPKVTLTTDEFVKIEGIVDLVWKQDELDFVEFYLFFDVKNTPQDSDDPGLAPFYVDDCSMTKADWAGEPFAQATPDPDATKEPEITPMLTVTPPPMPNATTAPAVTATKAAGATVQASPTSTGTGTADEPQKNGLLWILAAAAVILAGGGAAAVMISKKKSKGVTDKEPE